MKHLLFLLVLAGCTAPKTEAKKEAAAEIPAHVEKDLRDMAMEGLIQSGDLTKIDSPEETLRLAARHGRLNIIKHLLSNGVDINAQEDDYTNDVMDVYPGNTALIETVNYENFEIVQYLVEHGADININGGDPLRDASRLGHINIVKYLLEHGADVNAKRVNYSRTALTEADDLEIITYLVEHGANVNDIIHYHEGDDWTLLNKAIYAKDFEALQYLVEHGADINFAREIAMGNDIEMGRTALAHAVYEGNTGMVKYLIGKGADVNAKDHFDKDFPSTLVQTAMDYKYTNLAEYLESVGAQ